MYLVVNGNIVGTFGGYVNRTVADVALVLELVLVMLQVVELVLHSVLVIL